MIDKYAFPCIKVTRNVLYTAFLSGGKLAHKFFDDSILV
jgi:hypothetical protein